MRASKTFYSDPKDPRQRMRLPLRVPTTTDELKQFAVVPKRQSIGVAK